MRRLLAAGVVAVFLLVGGSFTVAANDAAAATPGGPRLAFFSSLFRDESAGRKASLKSHFVSVAARGGKPLPLFARPDLTVTALGRPSFSADGRRVLLLAYDARISDRRQGGLLVTDLHGRHAVAVRGSKGAIGGVLSPDGRSVAFALGDTVRISTLGGGGPRRLLRMRGRELEPTSFSPDGSLLAVTVTTENTQDVDEVDVADGTVTPLEREASETAFSSDGSQIAFISFRDREKVRPGFDEPEPASELYVAKADGSDPRRLTHTPEQEESYPSWDPSGNRLGYLRTPGGLLQFLGVKGEVMESNADGTCPKVLARGHEDGDGARTTVQAPVWIPGRGRSAGALSC